MGSKRALFTEVYFKNLADAIRKLLKTERKYKVKDMGDAIRSYDEFEYNEDSQMKSVNLDLHFGTDFDKAEESSAFFMHAPNGNVIYFPSEKKIFIRSLMEPGTKRGIAWEPYIAFPMHWPDPITKEWVVTGILPYHLKKLEDLQNGLPKTELVWKDNFVVQRGYPYGGPYWKANEYPLGASCTIDDELIPPPKDIGDYDVRFLNMEPNSSEYFRKLFSTGDKIKYSDLFKFSLEQGVERQITTNAAFNIQGNTAYIIYRSNYWRTVKHMLVQGFSADYMRYDAQNKQLYLPYNGQNYDILIGSANEDSPENRTVSDGLWLEPNDYNKYNRFTDYITNIEPEDLPNIVVANSAPVIDMDGNVLLEPTHKYEEIIPRTKELPRHSWALYNSLLTFDGKSRESIQTGLTDILSTRDETDEKWRWTKRIFQFKFVPIYTGNRYACLQTQTEGGGGFYAAISIEVDENFTFWLTGPWQPFSSIELGDLSGKDVKIIFNRKTTDVASVELYVNGYKSTVLRHTDSKQEFVTQFDILLNPTGGSNSELHIGSWTGNYTAGTFHYFNYDSIDEGGVYGGGF